jgi:hypothetical protein
MLFLVNETISMIFGSRDWGDGFSDESHHVQTPTEFSLVKIGMKYGVRKGVTQITQLT